MSIPSVDIAIIGAGPGGLAVAQGLRKHGIDVAVFERDAVRADYVQGFRLRMHQRGIDALQANLPPALYAAFEDTSGIAPATSLTVDEALRPLVSDAPAGGDRVHITSSVSRITLRQVLLSGLDDIIHYGRRFDRYETQPDGTVIAYFTDGSAVRANLLVGADGAGSAVRRQLLPDFRLADTGKRRLAGKLSLTAAEKFGIPQWLLDNNVQVRPQHGGRSLMITAHRVDPASFARHGLIGGNDPTHADRAGLHFDNTASYVWWNTAYDEGELGEDADLEALDGAALIEVLLGQIDHWDAALQKLVRHSDPSSVGFLKVRTSQPGSRWPTGPVTLLGDAIHSMTYFRALGANSALYDAGRLVAELVAARHGAKPLARAIADYEADMRLHGEEAVRESLAAMLRTTAPAQSAA